MFPGGKGGRCVGLTTLPPSCAAVLKYGLLELSGIVLACNGIALPFYCIPNIVQLTKSMSLRCAVHGTPGAEEKYVNKFVRGSLKKEITAKT
jgi:hypothetical protein